MALDVSSGMESAETEKSPLVISAVPMGLFWQVLIEPKFDV